ncbi:hypothetical protein SynPROSU1_02037 [Synechococcus sp. PROS-U-1]|nr:hypothetical protein SynPROSU1_02037 [Synechococcus sp. PROS-U-1]
MSEAQVFVQAFFLGLNSAQIWHTCTKAIKNRPLWSGGDISWGLTF